MKILIVEDSEIKAKNIASCVAQCDAEAIIVLATNAQDGFSLVASGGINLVLLDVLLPLKTGAEPSEDGSVWFVREVQRKVSDFNLPLIVGTTQYLDSLAKVEDIFRDHLWSIVFVSDTDIRWRNQIAYAIRFARASVTKHHLTQGDHIAIDVAIVTALRVPEFEEVFNAIGGGTPYLIPETSETWAVRQVKLNGGREVSIVVACADEMGMCAMATLVTRLCIATKPKKLILCGMMGGNASRVGMSDLVFVEETWNCRAGKITETGFESDTKAQFCSYKLMTAARTILTESDFVRFWQAWTSQKPRQIPQVHFGAVACSPAVIADEKVFKELEAQKRKVLGVEMEAYGCYDAVRRLGDLAPAVICLKSVCDLGDKDKPDIYQRYCAYISAQASLTLISDPRFLDA